MASDPKQIQKHNTRPSVLRSLTHHRPSQPLGTAMFLC